MQGRECSWLGRGSVGSCGLLDRGKERRRPDTMGFLMQLIGRFTVLEEFGENLVPAPVAVSDSGAGDLEVALQAEREAAGGGQRRTNLVRARSCGQRESSPTMSGLSTGKMNPQALGWNKRLRIGAAAPSRTPLVRLDRVISYFGARFLPGAPRRFNCEIEDLVEAKPGVGEDDIDGFLNAAYQQRWRIMKHPWICNPTRWLLWWGSWKLVPVKLRFGMKKGELNPGVQAVDRQDEHAGPGWTKSKRAQTGAAPPGSTPCPNRMTALEKAIREYMDNQTENRDVKFISLFMCHPTAASKAHGHTTLLA